MHEVPVWGMAIRAQGYSVDAMGKNRNAEQLTAKVLFAPLAGELAAHGKRRPAQGRPVEEGARSAALAAALCGLAIGGLSQARKRCRHHAFTGIRHAAGLAGGHDLRNASH